MLKETFFITHGNPILTVQDSHPLKPFFKSWREKVFFEKPKAILVISGHWETDYPSINAVHLNETIYDFDDYPDAMYQLKYPAPGAPDLAKTIAEILIKSGFETVTIDEKRGLDHGVWVPLTYMYPEANIPVCQLSVQPKLDGTYHYNLGQALAPLKDEGVLIIGSGSATHPLDETPHYYHGVAPWANEFHSWLHTCLIHGRVEDVNRYETKAPNWELAHPYPEHFYPLHVAVGAAGANWKAERIHSSWDHGTLYHGAYKFTST